VPLALVIAGRDRGTREQELVAGVVVATPILVADHRVPLAIRQDDLMHPESIFPPDQHRQSVRAASRADPCTRDSPDRMATAYDGGWWSRGD
jgi:hypothetical protein